MKNKFNLKRGDWLFTCSMKPLQFSHYCIKNPNDYNIKYDEMTPYEKMCFKYDNFETTNGSSHSISNCSCKPISKEYAEWFINNEIDTLFTQFEKEDNRWVLYESLVKEMSINSNILYDGI